MDNLQELKFKFNDEPTNKIHVIHGTSNELAIIVDDFNHRDINTTLARSSYIKRSGIELLPEHITIIKKEPLDKAFYDSVAGQYTPIPHADTIPMEVYKRIQTEQAKTNVIVRLIENTKAKNNLIHLGTHTRCICVETGISFAVALPSPLDTTMTLLHPFAFHNNVVAFIKQYQRNGIPLSGLEAQALAGMLITILKHKGYAVCRDYAAANLRLRTVNKKSLTWALAYFYRAFPRQHLPQINLLAEGNPTTQLIGFIQICKGEDSTVQALHSLERKQATVKAKVYQTDEAKEAAGLRNDIRVCLDIMEQLQKANPTIITDQLVTVFEQRIRKLAILNDAAKEILISDIIGCFGENAQTKQMELVIRTNDMTATQRELLTFSMEIEKERNEFQVEKKKEKLDFAVLMGRKQKE